jgi:hypothetical protein
MKILLYVLVLATLGVACVVKNTQVPTHMYYEVHGAVDYEPPSSYKTWWNRAHTCATYITGQDLSHRRFEDISWVVADSIKRRNDQARISGLWYGGTIYIDSNLVLFPPLIQHEMLHHIMSPLTHEDVEFMFCDPLSLGG